VSCKLFVWRLDSPVLSFNDLLHRDVLFIDYTVMEGDVILFRFNV
jgi:hypothetical protein